MTEADLQPLKWLQINRSLWAGYGKDGRIWEVRAYSGRGLARLGWEHGEHTADGFLVLGSVSAAKQWCAMEEGKKRSVCRSCKGEGQILYFHPRPNSAPGCNMIACPDCEGKLVGS